MIATFTALLTAHLLANFVLQSRSLAARQGQWRYLALHAVFVLLTTAVAVGAKTLPACTAVCAATILHKALDAARARYFGTGIRWLAAELGHFAIICGLTLLYPALAAAGWWSILAGDLQAWVYAAMTLASGVAAAVPLGGILIKTLVERLAPPPITLPPTPGVVPTTITGMPEGGKYIGWLERGLTLIFILAGRFDAVGLLLTAKSILRFRDIQNSADRHLQEYIIIGTMLSFGWGIGVALVAARAIAFWGVG